MKYRVFLLPGIIRVAGLSDGCGRGRGPRVGEQSLTQPFKRKSNVPRRVKEMIARSRVELLARSSFEPVASSVQLVVSRRVKELIARSRVEPVASSFQPVALCPATRLPESAAPAL